MNRRPARTVAIALVSLALMGTTALSGAQALAPRPSQAHGAATPIDTARQMSARDRAAIDRAATTYLASSMDGTPGLWIAVWDPKRGYYEQAYGQAVVGGAKATTRDHVLIGSITKTVFATAVLEQVAQGTLSLNDTVRDLDPALARTYPPIAKKTVRQLLGMTSRIPDYADAAVQIMVTDHQHSFTRDDLIALGLAEGKPIKAPGGYSTTNYIILGKVLQTVTGRTPEQLVNAVFRQAGMRQSRLPARTTVLPVPHADGYVGAVYGQQFATLDPTISAATDVNGWTMDWGREGGGAYSTIGDLARWGGTCLGTTLLPGPIAKQRLQTTAIDAGNYGLGIIEQGSWLAHSGQALGFEANVACDPRSGAVVAVAVNSTEGMFDLNSQIGDVAYPAYIASLAARS